MRTFILMFIFVLLALVELDVANCQQWSMTETNNNNYYVYYNLYTQTDKNQPQIIRDIKKLKDSDFDPRKLSVFFIHGWMFNSNAKELLIIKDAALQNHNINYFAVDWSQVSSSPYGYARDKVKPIGRVIGKFINKIQHIYKLNGSSFLLVGHSLGAHVAGNAGSIIKKKIDRIVGLDPAGPEFLDNVEDRLNASHANYVEVIHTDDRDLGLVKPIGHVNYFANGGMTQPGCANASLLISACDHHMSNKYFAESLGSGPKFEAVACDNYENFLLGACKNNSRSVMGGLIKSEKADGNYYFETGKEAPYAVIDEETKQQSVENKLANYRKVKQQRGSFIYYLTQFFKKSRDYGTPNNIFLTFKPPNFW